MKLMSPVNHSYGHIITKRIIGMTEKARVAMTPKHQYISSSRQKAIIVSPMVMPVHMVSAIQTVYQL